MRPMQKKQKLNTLLISVLLSISGNAWSDTSENLDYPTTESQPVLQQFTEKAQGIIDYALSLTGVPYKFGSSNPDKGLDCSGFIKNVFSEATGLSLPHNALAISLIGDKIKSSELQPGDLVFFKTLRHAFSHVGIYLGKYKFVHAATRGGEVMISDMRDKYWTHRFNGARRIDATEEIYPVKVSLGPVAGASE